MGVVLKFFVNWVSARGGSVYDLKVYFELQCIGVNYDFDDLTIVVVWVCFASPFGCKDLFLDGFVLEA